MPGNFLNNYCTNFQHYFSIFTEINSAIYFSSKMIMLYPRVLSGYYMCVLSVYHTRKKLVYLIRVYYSGYLRVRVRYTDNTQIISG